jgi:tetratricopeptide (TPR) repeat protein
MDNRDVAARDYLVQLTPSVAKSHDDFGVSLTFAGELDRAISAHQEATEVDGGYARAHTHLGIAYSLKGDRQQAIAIDPELPQAHYNLGIDLFGIGQSAEARAESARATALDQHYSVLGISVRCAS